MPLNLGFVGVATPLTAELTSAFAAFLDAEADATSNNAAPDTPPPPYAAPLLLAPVPGCEERRCASVDAPAGAEVVGDLAALAQRADAVFVYLPTDAAQTAAIKALITAPRPKDRDPLALILLAGASAASLAAATKANKACPVATAHIVGGGDAARRLALLAFVAGPSPPKTIARTLLAPLCADAVDVGDDPDAGAALAAAAALLTAGLLEATAEAVAAAEAMRVPRARATVARLAAELAGGGAAAFLGPAAAARRMADAASRPAPPDAAVAELVDAVKHGLAAAKAVKAPTPAAAAAAVHLQQVEESGGGHLDAAALVAAVRDAAGVPP